jgi:hypothetical protein
MVLDFIREILNLSIATLRPVYRSASTIHVESWHLSYNHLLLHNENMQVFFFKFSKKGEKIQLLKVHLKYMDVANSPRPITS